MSDKCIVKVFCVTKNEYDLIEHFIIYYGYLFGYNNVIIIDNNSTNKIVLDIYDKYINLGITVVNGESYQGEGQSNSFNKYMKLLQFECDFLIGLDTDEFLFSCDDFKNNNNPFCKEKIFQILNSYNINDTKFKINLYPGSIVDNTNINYINNKFINPSMEIIYFSDILTDTPLNITPKYFTRSNAFISTSNGNHSVNTTHGNTVNSSFGLLHFNNTGKRRFYERAKQVIEGYNYFSTSLEISEQIDTLVFNKGNFRSGIHKVKAYHIILLRMFILDLFIEYIKRLPSQDELHMHTIININNNSADIKNKFKNCKEAYLNKEKIFIFSDKNEKDKVIFYDTPLNELDPNDIYKNTYLQELLKKLCVCVNP